jgi:rhamnogalacturonan endolyase
MFERLLAYTLRLVMVATAWPGLAVGSELLDFDESEGRGLVACRCDEGVFVQWRWLPSDTADTAFRVYRKLPSGEIQLCSPAPIVDSTCWLDRTDNVGDATHYVVRALVDGIEQPTVATASIADESFVDIPIQTIEGYRPGDASIADLDGDGQYEFVLHQVSRPRDNSHSGITGTPVLDAYKLDGTLLWRIDLGHNIREGEHYTQFMVYDLDGDGKAEVACKTADGTVDGRGQTIGDADADWRQLDPASPAHGRVLAGPEFLTVFSGETGAALATVDYVPSRDPIDGWGGIGGNGGNDNYGNRCDRFLAGVAYLDGKRPSLIMCRGVYGRTAIVAWDWRDGQLAQRWVFDTRASYPPYDDASPYAGMGGHSLVVADVDADGRDEIVYQAMVVDDDGRGLYSTGLRHGDAVYVSDIDPQRPGLEVFTIQENEGRTRQLQTPGAALRDAASGEILWSHSPGIDVGGGMVADIDPRHPGCEVWGGPGGLRTAAGRVIGPAPRTTNFAIWWDGDLLRELVARDRITKWNWQQAREETLCEFDGFTAPRGPNLVADIMGDWREELVIVAPHGGALRIYSTTIPTAHRMVSLMHDRQYRLAVAAQNVAYNKPPLPSFFLGASTATVQPPGTVNANDK